MPADVDPGMAFVLVQHLAPEHKSILAELIRRHTRMPVFEVEDGMVVRANCVYIIPPNHDMAFLNGTLQLLDPVVPRGQRLPIDFFFRSLAQDQRAQAIGIVLSGTASDGTLGVRAIKGEGGMVMVQSPESTEFDGMPSSAIATGLVDYVLLPAEMPAQLMAYSVHAFGKPRTPETIPSPKAESALKKIFILLRNQTGHDFSQYKPSAIHRRIERRMAVHQIDSTDTYVKYLQQTPTEVEALFRDLLIGVTNFFRDPDAFKVLEEQIIPRLVADKPPGSVIRLWSTGCSTGEEAYSLAILLYECMEAQQQSHTVQLFATDIDSRAIATARAGVYPASIATDISPERLARFFTAEPGGKAYRINKGIRDMLVFSEQDVIKDPPFSKLDLISCRNLLIYFGADLQKKLMPLFHYALNPRGILFLGTSEGVGESVELFAALDRKAKLYQRQDDLDGVPRLALARVVPSLRALPAALPPPQGKPAFAAKRPLRELTEQAIFQQIALAGALVNARGDILYLHGRTGLYLEPPPGEASYNIIKMARQGLRHQLTIALHQATTGQQAIYAPGLNVRSNGHFTRVNLSISRVPAGQPGAAASPGAQESNDAALYLVLLEEAPALETALPPTLPDDANADADSPEAVAAALISTLKAELHARDEHLQCFNEEMESSNEELKSSNEEMQSMNEELQSTNEEMETAKEELQSVNEELATVNNELQTKIVDLTRLNNDMNNLLAGTGIATVFVDLQLRILRFTPTAKEVINLIDSDVGRPVAHIVSNLAGYRDLVADTKAVLDTLIPKEVDVQTTSSRWYSMHIQPYRTIDHAIEGAVLTFVDITAVKQARDALQKSEERYRELIVNLEAGVVVHAPDSSITTCNPRSSDLMGLSGDQMKGKLALDPGWKFIDESRAPLPLEDYPVSRIIAGKKAIKNQILGVCRPLTNDVVWLTVNGFPVFDRPGELSEVVVSFIDLTERKQAEEALAKANDLLRLAVVVRDAHDAITVQDLAGRTLAWNPGAVRLYGWSETEALAMNVSGRIPQELREGALDKLIQLGRAEVLEPYLTQRLCKNGTPLTVSIISTALLDAAGQMYAIATTERVKEAALKILQERKNERPG